MLREIGITMFLACVGLGAGNGFVETIVNGGYAWIGYGFIITLLPLLIIGFIARKFCKINYFTLMGMIAGSTTDPPCFGLLKCYGGKRCAICRLRYGLSAFHVPARRHSPVADTLLRVGVGINQMMSK